MTIAVTFDGFNGEETVTGRIISGGTNVITFEADDTWYNVHKADMEISWFNGQCQEAYNIIEWAITK